MQSELDKFVQINWCGDGVPEARKGLFYSHSAAVASFLKGSHVVISARNEVRRPARPLHARSHRPAQSDVSPALIMSRVEAASGAKYSAHKEAPRRSEPIAPVGTNYVPVGRPDIDSLRRVPPAPSSAPSAAAARAPPPPSAPRPTAAASPATSFGRAPAAGARVAAPEDSWDAPAVGKPPPPPAAPRPAVVAAPRPAPVRARPR